MLTDRLRDLPGLLAGAGIDPELVAPQGAAPAGASEDEMLAGVRSGWL